MKQSLKQKCLKKKNEKKDNFNKSKPKNRDNDIKQNNY